MRSDISPFSPSAVHKNSLSCFTLNFTFKLQFHCGLYVNHFDMDFLSCFSGCISNEFSANITKCFMLANLFKNPMNQGIFLY